MFTIDLCTYQGCRKQAISHIDSGGQISREAFFCAEHAPDGSQQRILQYILENKKIIGLCASGLTFSDQDFSDRKFYGCNFRHCTFNSIHSTGCRIRISVFDFANFSDCSLLKSNIQYVSFAGCTFSHVLFTESELVHNNFNGIISHQSSFDDSDLYNSRFIRAQLIDTSICNCNIKKTVFYESMQNNVSFKLSNTREAFFSQETEEK